MYITKNVTLKPLNFLQIMVIRIYASFSPYRSMNIQISVTQGPNIVLLEGLLWLAISNKKKKHKDTHYIYKIETQKQLLKLLFY